MAEQHSPTRRRIAFVLAALPLLLLGLTALAPESSGDPLDRLHGAESIKVSTSDAEPSWWRDPIVDPPDGRSKEPVAELVMPGDALFDIGSDTISPTSVAALHDAVRSLGSIAIGHGTVRCHTDDTGSDASNVDLSNRRAVAVVAELTALGFDPRAIEASGAGESEPMYDNSTETGRARNRRCEIQLTILR